VPPRPDPRWESFHSTFDDLEALSVEWLALMPPMPEEGPRALLRTARSLFVNSWFDYDFMVVACLVSFQALEASLRELFPDTKQRTSFRTLVRRAEREGVLPQNIAEIAVTGVDLRNLLSHPATRTAWTPGMAESVLETTHRLVGLISKEAAVRGMTTS
jgi:hypothetical protein